MAQTPHPHTTASAATTGAGSAASARGGEPAFLVEGLV